MLSVDHDIALQGIAMLGEEPEKSMASAEFKKAYYSNKALTTIYRQVVQRPSHIYPEKIVTFAKTFLEKVDAEEQKKKREIINLRLSINEKAELEERANANNKSVSQYIREVLFAKEGDAE